MFDRVLNVPLETNGKQLKTNDPISSVKRRASNKFLPLISAASLGIHIEIIASL